MEDDRDLEAAFRALRDSDAGRAPSFETILDRPAPPPRPLPVVRAGALAIAFVGLLATSVLVVSRTRNPRPAPCDVWAWKSPTRSLLPPSGLAPAVPRIGETWGDPTSKNQEEPK